MTFQRLSLSVASFPGDFRTIENRNPTHRRTASAGNAALPASPRQVSQAKGNKPRLRRDRTVNETTAELFSKKAPVEPLRIPLVRIRRSVKAAAAFPPAKRRLPAKREA